MLGLYFQYNTLDWPDMLTSGHTAGTIDQHSAGAITVEGPAPCPAAHSHGGNEGLVAGGPGPFCPHP